MLSARSLAPLFALLTLSASAQTADTPKIETVRVLHPAPPLLSYEVDTIKPEVPVTYPNGSTVYPGTTLLQYIRAAYSPNSGALPPSQVIGGPEWIDKDRYTITGKPPADLEVARQKMMLAERFQQDHIFEQSLLAERFHLKVHFEVREMPVYALVPAKGSLKIKAVDAPAPLDPANPPPAPSSPNQLRPGGLMAGMGGGMRFLRARTITMANFAGWISGQTADTGGRPVIDQTGFTGFFDIDNLKWAPAGEEGPNSQDLPSLGTALEESLGIKLVATKGPVEVVVIDSIDHPSEN